jgi:HK97 family phage portal protein
MWPFTRRREEQRAINAWPWDEGGPVPGRAMNVDRALSLVPVFGAVRLLTDSVASLTPQLFKMGANGVPVLQSTPSLFAQPSVHGTLVDWQERAVASMALQGDAVGLITERDYYGWPTMIEWLNPDEVYVQDAALVGPGSYMSPLWYWRGRRVRNEDIVHIPWFSLPYRVRGLSPIGAFRVTANVGLAAAEYADAWFRNGGVPPGTFQNTRQTVTKEDADLITARVTQRMRDRKPLVYGSDWMYTPIAITPNEAQFVETMRLTATQIAVIYGVPPEKIGGSTGSSLTYATQEMNSLDFLTFSLRPWLCKLEAAFTRLVPRGYFVKYDTDDIIRVDAKTRAEIDAMSLNKQPWRDPDEVRADRGMQPMMPKPKPMQQLLPAPAVDPAATEPMNGSKPLTAVGEN